MHYNARTHSTIDVLTIRALNEIGLTGKERGKATEEAAEAADRVSTLLLIKHE